MSVTFKAFLDCYKNITETRLPVMLRSRHGQGKSCVVYQIGKQLGLKVIERRASQMTEGDLLGLPKITGDCTEWLPPDWLKQACDEPVLLFIDELDRATQEVRQGFFELCDSRKIAGKHLHLDTLIFSAINGGENTAQYQVGEMDPAELDRWVVFDVEPSVEDWLLWASENNAIEKIVTDFINDNHNHLEHKGDYEPNKVYPSRRSWHRFSDCIRKAIKSGEELVEPGNPSPKLYNLSTAFVGFEAAIALQDYVKKYQKVVTPEDIIDKGKLDLIEKWGIPDHVAFIEKCYTSGVLKNKLNKSQVENLAKYLLVIPSEPSMKLISNLAESNSENLINVYAYPGVSDRILKFNLNEVEQKEHDEQKRSENISSPKSSKSSKKSLKK